MSSFTNDYKTTQVGDNLYRVDESFKFYLNDSLDGEYVLVEKGQHTNYASIPFPFNKLIDPQDEHIAKAAILHDVLVGEFEFKVSVLIENARGEIVKIRTVGWFEAAKIFKKACKILGAKKWKYWACYYGVYLYGIYKLKFIWDN